MKLKRFVWLFAFFCLALVLILPGQLVNADDRYDPPYPPEDGYYYDITDDDELFITDCYKTVSGNLMIPSELAGYPVTGIANGAFYYCNATSVTIPDSVTSIGASAFSTCKNLTAIWVDENNAVYCSDASGVLYDKAMTTLLCIPNTMHGDYTIPDSVTSIGEYAFNNCSSLTSVTIPGSVISIGEYAFNKCTSLTSATILDGVTSIGKNAFNNCTSLTSVTIPGSVIGIGEYAFNNCSSLTSVTILDGVTQICFATFEGCSSLTSVVIPDSVTNIGTQAFYGCSSLTSVVIPDSVTNIGTYTFYGCSSLTSVVIPDSVTSIDHGAFDRCSSLTSVTIPDSVTSIGTSVFLGCSSLTSVVIPDSVTSIGNYAFDGCSSLASVTIPGSVISIGKKTFFDCSSLTSVVIPDSVTSIGDHAFYGCSNLKKVIYCGTEEQWNAISIYSDNGLLRSATRQYHNFANGKCTICGESDQSVQLPEEGMSWSYQDGTLTISGTGPMPDSQHHFGFPFYATPDDENALPDDREGGPSAPWLSYAKQITHVQIEDGITYIGDEAFYGLYNMTSVSIPESVTGIGDRAFVNCMALTSVTIPDSVTFLGIGVFQNCSGLQEVNMGKGVTNLEEGTFYYCTNLKKVTFSPNMDTIPVGMFSHCTSLSELEIPQQITAIGNYAFTHTTALKTIRIPKSVSEIGRYAFHGGLLETIIFCGTEEQWNAIAINGGNTALTNATRQYHVWQEIGSQTYTCEICGASANPCIGGGHIVATSAAVAPTCTETGLTEGSHCSRCEEVLVAQQTVPALGHSFSYIDNGDGTHDYSCSRCGYAEIDNAAHSYTNRLCICGAKEVLAINGEVRAKTLLLEDIIYMRATVAFLEGECNHSKITKDEILKNGRLLFWSEKKLPAGELTVENATAVQPLTDAGIYNDGIQEYTAYSYGVAAKEYGDTIYYCTYIVIDGVEYYGQMNEYSVLTYANRQMKKDDDSLKPLLAAILNYGAAAQRQFGYKTNQLVNAGLQEFVDNGLLDAQYLQVQWDEALLDTPSAVEAELARNFQSKYVWRATRAVVLEGNIQPRMSFAYNPNGDRGIKVPAGASVAVYYWSNADYNRLYDEERALSKDNATRVYTGSEVELVYKSNYGYVYQVDFEGLAAKKMGEPIYIAAVFTMADGTEYTSDVEVYSPEVYAASMLKKESTTEILADLLKAMICYGEAAKTYFGK